MNEEVKQHVEDKVAVVRKIFETVATIIDLMKPEQRMTRGNLAELVSGQCGIDKAKCGIILTLLYEGYPGIESKAGANGGLIKQ